MKEEDRKRAILQRLAAMNPDPPLRPPLPTGFPALDRALGGGLPRGRILEWFGPSGCGKTTLAIQILAHLQRGGATVAWIDADHAFDPAYAFKLGLDMERVPLAQPASAEQALETVRQLAMSSAVEAIVVDSAAALLPQLELEIGIGSVPGLQSRVLATGLRKLRLGMRSSDACVVFLNQMRNRMEGSSGERVTSAGGIPLKLYADVRLALSRSGAARLCVRTLRNKAAASSGECELEWRQGSGFVESP
jgi:recombination protein RecA